MALLDYLGLVPRGVVIGVMIAAPVGPVGLLCIRRTLHKGISDGFLVGFGAALADFLFAGVASFGVASVLAFVGRFSDILHLLGGVVLFAAAWHTWRDRPKAAHEPGVAKAKVGKAIKSVLTGFGITITNPATLFGTLAIVAAFGGMTNRTEAASLVLGIFLGSSLWWGVLSGGTALVRHKLNDKKILLINKITAFLLGAVGIWALHVGITQLLGYGKTLN